MSPESKQMYRVNRELAEGIADLLIKRDHQCLRIPERIGGLPHIRYRDGEWQIATWAGAGELMTGTKDEEEILDVIQSGPVLELVAIDELDIWEEADFDE